MTYQKRLRNLREDHDLSRRQIAELLFISQSVYARYEQGLTALPSDDLKKLCELYGVSADFILGLDQTAAEGKENHSLRRCPLCGRARAF
ncbi:MAG: helix-turn-helix transcriptional regulator [Clostridiales bacterium]|nr:helix-turn-helix transcriptional regulator [Clostridiales bacterium]